MSRAARDARYQASAKGKARAARHNAHSNPRRLRMGAGGTTIYIGLAPTPEAADHIRTMIREEAPHGAVRNA